MRDAHRRRRSIAIVAIAVVGSLSAAPAARAASGDLDPTFGGDGIVRTDLTPAEDDGFAVAIQSDGKIVVAGEMGIGGPNPRFGIVRYGTDGSLDRSFGGGDGKVSIDFTPGDDFAYAVRIQADGKIVVAGAAAYFGSNSRFALARLTSDGSLDQTFADDGTVITNLTPSYDWANGMALQPDGKIVLVGSVSAGSSNGKIGVLRYRSDGSLDPTFGGDGIVLADPTRTYDDGLAVGVEADGQIVVAGGAGFTGPNERFVALAYQPDGSLDPTFGGDGMVFTDPTPKADVPFALAIQDDGRIVVAGGAANDADPKFALVRYERDGSLDPSFKGDGTVITNFSPYDDGAYSVAIDPDGRIVAAGLAGYGGRAPRFATVRYLANGTRDTTFGGDGKISTDITPSFDSAWGVAVQPDGSVVCSGVAGAGDPNPSFAVLRYQP
jgi:uncharacterized delta-60 repeat protein